MLVLSVAESFWMVAWSSGFDFSFENKNKIYGKYAIELCCLRSTFATAKTKPTKVVVAVDDYTVMAEGRTVGNHFVVGWSR